jgi:hypothetical protein
VRLQPWVRGEGFDAYNLKGSILSWTHAGGQLVRQSAQSRQLRSTDLGQSRLFRSSNERA